MKPNALFIVMSAITGLTSLAQRPTMELTFTAENNGLHVQLESINVMNITQGRDTILYWPDTVLVFDYQVGMPKRSRDETGFQVFQYYPNPVA